MTPSMRAAVVERYGPPEVVRVAEVPRPGVKRRDVLVQVRSTAVTSGDARIRGGRFPPGFGPLARIAFGVSGPRRKILGSSFAGVVETVGRDVSRFAPGQAVCGMTGTKLGAHAEYVAVRDDRLARIPRGVSSDDAAGVLFGGTAALCFLGARDAVTQDRSVLVNGASGAVGTNAVQLPKHFGARVTAVTSSAHAGLVRDLGADDVIDSTNDDLTRVGRRFDLVLDCVGNLTIRSGRHLLSDDGTLVLAVASLWDTIRARGDVVAASAPERVEDFELLLGLVAAGKLTVVHDDTYGLDEIVEAHRLVDTGHKCGNVIVRP